MNRDRLYLLTIAALLVIIILLRECSGGGGDCPDPVKSDTVRVVTVAVDTVATTIYNDRPVIRYRDTGRVVERVDTVEVMREFFTTNYYLDTLSEDSSYILVISDTVHRNAINGRSVVFTNLRPKVTVREVITNTEEQRKRGALFVAPIIGVGQNGEINLGAGALVLTRRGHGYSFHYDAVQRDYRIGLWFKVRLRKKK